MIGAGARVRRVAIAFSLAAGIAAAQPTAQARAHAEALFREGVKLAEAKALDQACAKFEESQRLDPQPGTLLYLATCHEEQGKTATAWIEFNRAATLAARAGQEERAELAKKRAAALEPSLSHVVIKVDASPPGLVITLDGERLGPASLGTRLPVDPGEHSLAVSASNHEPWSTTFSVTPGQAVATIAVPQLSPRPATDARPRPAASRPTRDPNHSEHDDGGSSTLRSLGFVGIGVGVAGIATGSYFGLRARSLWDDAERHCSDDYCEDTGIEKTDQAKRAALISTLSFGIGIAATGAGVSCLIAARPKPRERAGLVLTSQPTPGGATISVRRAW